MHVSYARVEAQMAAMNDALTAARSENSELWRFVQQLHQSLSLLVTHNHMNVSLPPLPHLAHTTAHTHQAAAAAAAASSAAAADSASPFPFPDPLMFAHALPPATGIARDDLRLPGATVDRSFCLS